MRYDELDQDSSRLFATSGEWDVLSMKLAHHRSTGSASFGKETITDVEGLFGRSDLPFSPKREATRVFVIRQQNSWGRFCISLAGFKAILATCNAFPEFQKYVRAFGFKVSDTDDDFGGYSRHIDLGGDRAPTAFELCYNIRYVDKVDRDEYPWVFRQLAVYCRTNTDPTATSDFILLQPPERVVDGLTRLLEEDTSHRGYGSRDANVRHLNSSYAINVMVLQSTESRWRSFIDHVESEYRIFRSKGCFSRVGRRATNHDYSVAFHDAQELHSLREQLQRSLSAIDSSLETAVGIRNQFVDLYDAHNLNNLGKNFHMQLECYQVCMRSHRRAVVRLLEVSQGIFTLLLKTLDFRNDEMAIKNSTVVQSILLAAGSESESLKRIAEKTQVDSRTMKILSRIALIYLPANLIASIFGANVFTSFIDNTSGLFISYIIITSCFMILTLAAFYIEEKGIGSITKRLHIGGV